MANYSPTHSNQICDQNQVTSSLDTQPMSPMSPLSPMQQNQQPQQPPSASQSAQNPMNEMPGMVVDQIDVSLQSNIVDPMSQYRRSGKKTFFDVHRLSFKRLFPAFYRC